MKKSLLANKPTLKVCSFILGCLVWNVISNHQVVTRTITIPVCFHAMPGTIRITQAPENIQIAVRAHRKDLYQLSTATSSLQIDGRTLQIGTNTVALQREKLVVPDRIAVLDYSPSAITIITQKIS